MGNSLTSESKSCYCIYLIPLECPSGLSRGSRIILSDNAKLRKECVSDGPREDDHMLQDTSLFLNELTLQSHGNLSIKISLFYLGLEHFIGDFSCLNIVLL